MLYKKNSTQRLDKELFRNPTAEYRGTPFWAWNGKLEQKELERQLEVLNKMGFGGAHMHVRTGMSTPYLSEEFMDLIKACVQKSKDEDMLSWLYDEDRYPSGFAGGLVTMDKRYRARFMRFTPFEQDDAEDRKFLACYDVELNSEGYLVSWRMVAEDEPVQHEKWYAYQELEQETPRFNNQTYVNTLDKAAMDKFIEITYESYKEAVGDEFDRTIPSIFTDEPQFTRKSTLKYSTEKKDVNLPWTDDLPDTFAAAYDGQDLLAGIPELIWERADSMPSVLRYRYHDHVCQRFTEAFADNCGKWCNEHNLALTGHMMNEPSLLSQTASLGETMRSYRNFGLPGIDMLCAWFEYTTAKQTQSAVHQYGREGMLSELYGVTNWDFDFRGHKLHGDWQAALGVTIRVPHLSWYTMAGSAKRDYPASISYQSPWWEKYSLVEDHFARVNTALTRGKPVVKVGVIHPIESYWLHWGPAEQTALVRENMDENFKNLTKWLLFGGIDFDFISESLLPELCENAGNPFQVGKMAYDVILVPSCETLRSTTLDRLESFAAAGGRLIFAGELPALEDAVPSGRGRLLAQKVEQVQFNRGALLKALESVRLIEIRNQTGALTDNLLHQIRQDEEGCWLFIAHGTEPYNKDISRFQDLKVRLKGKWKVTLYNTMSGETEAIEYIISEGATVINCRIYDYDSLLFWLESAEETAERIGEAGNSGVLTAKEQTEHNPAENEQLAESLARKSQIAKGQADITDGYILPFTVPYTLSELNVLLLDQAEYALDDGPWKPREEVLRLDEECRLELGWASQNMSVAQPWVIAEEPVRHTMHLRFHISSAIEYKGAQLAIENTESVKLKWNGQEVANTVTGWYVDKAIKTVALPDIQVGDNILEASVPFGTRTNVEWIYLLGYFGVEVCGRKASISALPKKIAFGDITRQGLPFYGGNITYHIPVTTAGGKIGIRSNRYRGVLQTVSVDEGKEISITYPPYAFDLGDVEPGRHTIHLSLYGHRRNSFGPVHLTDLKERWIGALAWRSQGERWTYDYMLTEEGVLCSPQIFDIRG